MTLSHTAARALAVDIRQVDTGALIGVALIVPSDRFAVTLARSGGNTEERTLTDGEWREIEAWAAAGDAGLPAEPPPLKPEVAAALLEDERPAVARRFASIPFGAIPGANVSLVAGRMLPALLKARS